MEAKRTHAILTTDTILISSQNGFGDQTNKTTTTSLIINWVSLVILFLSIVAFVLLVTGSIFVFPTFKLKLCFKISLVTSTFFVNYAHSNILSLKIIQSTKQFFIKSMCSQLKCRV